MNTPLENEIAKRFGLLPNFFRLASSDRAITTNLWGFVQFGNLDNPLPSLFKVFARSVTASPGTSVSVGQRVVHEFRRLPSPNSMSNTWPSL